MEKEKTFVFIDDSEYTSYANPYPELDEISEQIIKNTMEKFGLIEDKDSTN